MAAVPPEQALPKIDNSFGAVFIGYSVVAIFYGITCVQTYIYFTKFPKDGRVLKTSIFILWILDSLQLAFVAQMLYHYVIANYGNPEALNIITWSFPVETIVTTINDGIIRCIYARRIWTLTKNKWSTGLILVLTLAVSGTCLAIVAHMFQLRTFDSLPHIRPLISSAFTAVAATDTAIASLLCFNFLQRRSGFKRTDTQLQILIKYAIHTALLTSIVAITSLITFLTMPHNLVFIAIFITLPKLFLNSLLATLNAREQLRERFESNIESVHLSRIPGGGSELSSDFSKREQPMMFDLGCVKVDREEVQTDGDGYAISGQTKTIEINMDTTCKV
ncbi:hypothetical protein ABKN59_007104 [Abortiporus biennis]